MDIREEKAALRRRIRTLRRGLDKDKRRGWDMLITERVLGLEEYKRAETVFCFISYGGEPETRGIIKEALRQGKRVCVPRCIDDGIMECVLITSLDGLEKSPIGIMEPKQGLPVIGFDEIDFAVVPGIAFTREGARLGQGGGYYDRFMASSKAFTCGICYKVFLLESIPSESHDRAVSCVVTN